MGYKTFIEKFENDVEVINTSNDDLYHKNIALIKLCQNSLSKLKTEMKKLGFKDENAEIDFFKRIKRVPLHNLIYYTELRSFEIKFPVGSKRKKAKYINGELDKLNRFFEYNIDFIQYIDSNQVHLDEVYFLRKNLDFLRTVHLKLYNIDPEFNTSHDLLLAKLHGYRKLADYLTKRLNRLQNPSFKEIPKSQLKWTSSKAALTELTYALYHGGAVNHGNTDIREIATALEQTFNFSIGDVYHTYSEIRSRKKRRSKFLDELSTSLLSGMDSLDE